MTYGSKLKLDYKATTAPRRKSTRHLHLFIGGTLIPVIALLIIINTGDANAIKPEISQNIDHASNKQFSLALPGKDSNPVSTKDENGLLQSRLAAESNIDVIEKTDWETLTVKSGDSLAILFDRAKLPASDWISLSRLPEHGTSLSKLYPGNEIRIRRDTTGIVELIRELSESQTLYVTRTADGWDSQLIEHPLEPRLAYAHANISSSLFMAGLEGGLPDNLIMELANIFGWDIDFALDIRKDDTFTLIYEELYRDGSFIRTGNILAAEFINQGQTFRAVRYADDGKTGSYYTPDGRSMRKAFLRTPVDFARVSSRFNPNRKHPVLNTVRAHKGVDYAAPTGTRIKASGQGKVIFVGTKGGYGKTVILRHGNRYTTLYAHMSRFAKGIRAGKSVKQGQTIGYVGKTGLASGPHLHYEFRVNGVHKDPQRVKSPQAAPLPDKYKTEFDAIAEPLLAQLSVIQRTKLAALTE